MERSTAKGTVHPNGDYTPFDIEEDDDEDDYRGCAGSR